MGFRDRSQLGDETARVGKMSPELFDVVELVTDLPEQGLYAGIQGTIIEIHQDGAAYEVEFANEQGEALNFLALSPEQFLVADRET